MNLYDIHTHSSTLPSSQDIIRKMAEDYTVLRRDALNLGNTHLRYWVEK